MLKLKYAIRYMLCYSYCRRHKYLTDILPQADDISLDLLNKLLNFNPNKRLTAANCLEHPYLSKYTSRYMYTCICTLCTY